MKAYLARNLTINDFGGFRDYIAAIPAHVARHDGRYIVQGVEPTCTTSPLASSYGMTIEERGLKCKWVE
jgi:uncharacterized protein (DUF1330 family)